MKQEFFAACRAVKHGLADAVYRCRHKGLRTSGPRQRLAVFYLFADAHKYPHSLDVVEQALSRLHGFDVTLVLINNFDETAEFRQIGPGRFTSPGNNSQWEFSGWKRGVQLFDSLSSGADVALFVNDAFMNLTTGGQDRYWFRNAFNSLTLATLGHRVLGHVHPAPPGHAIAGWNSGCFLQTHAFAMPYPVARRLKFTPLTEAELERFLPKIFTGSWFNADAPCSPIFQDFVSHYLTRQWHARRPFNAESWPLLRAKTIAIINERLFSQELLDHGCEIVNAGHVSLWTGTSPMIPPSVPRDAGINTFLQVGQFVK